MDMAIRDDRPIVAASVLVAFLGVPLIKPLVLAGLSVGLRKEWGGGR